MAERPYPYFSNTFLVVTENNYAKMDRLSSFTDLALAAVPSLAAQLAIVRPKRIAYKAIFEQWKGSRGERKTSTQSFKVLTEDLPRQLREWDFEIQHFARKGTPEYNTYFPEGYAPFTTGRQEDRLHAVSILVQELDKLTPVPAIRDTINDYLTDMNLAFANKSGKNTVTDTLSDAVEAARIEMGVALFKAMAQLMDKFAENPTQAEPFFDMEELRRRPQDDFTGHTPAQQRETVVKRTMDPDALVTIRNNGLVPITIYWAHVKDGAMPAGTTGLTLQSGEQTQVPASSLGNNETDKFLVVYNASEVAEADWEVEL